METIINSTGFRFARIWAMPNQWTFTIPPIKTLLAEELKGHEIVVDPFAGENSPATVTNDLNPERPTTFHMDALAFLKTLPDQYADAILFDPPYSISQAKECYDSFGVDKLDIHPTSMEYWSECKNQISRITKPCGKVICFGWSTMGLGKDRGFEMTRILLVPHGGTRNDTIVTVELKQPTLF